MRRGARLTVGSRLALAAGPLLPMSFQLQKNGPSSMPWLGTGKLGVRPLALPCGQTRPGGVTVTAVCHRWTLDGGLIVFSQHIASCMLLRPVLHRSPISRTGPGTQQVFKKYWLTE